MRAQWKGKLYIKGVLDPEDAVRAVDLGADGVVVSNHGGRQLDGVAATIDALPEVVEAVDGRVEVLVDGGVRRGTDVVKALALGARACRTGRALVYGLGAGGDAGVSRVFTMLEEELTRAMALLGCRSVSELDRSFVA
jgi:L-lactate dehydrogenase (cytochrome)